MSQKAALIPATSGDILQISSELSAVTAGRDVERRAQLTDAEESFENRSRVSKRQGIRKSAMLSLPGEGSSPTGQNASSFLVQSDYTLQDLIYEKERGWRFRGPLNVITGIFTCWSRSKDRAGMDSRARVSDIATAAYLEQTRLQQEALMETQEVLMETQDTRDMWEWQMEQQQVLSSQEHDLMERSSVDNPMGVLPSDLMRNSSARRSASMGILEILSRNTSVRREQESSAKEQPDGESDSPSRADSAEWDIYRQINGVWQDPDLVSTIFLLFESALLRCQSEVNYFCRAYMKQMVLQGYSLIRTLLEMEPDTVFLRKVHASYALESRINSVLFRCFENDSFDDSGLTQVFDPAARALTRLQDYLRMKCADPNDALRNDNPCYDPAFHSFFVNKIDEILAMFPWNMAYRTTQERDRFIDAFLKAAKWVWLLHRLAFATNPQINIIRVGRGMNVDPLYVEAVALPPPGSCENCPIPKVEFMIMPGFIAHRKVFRCKVYQHYVCK